VKSSPKRFRASATSASDRPGAASAFRLIRPPTFSLHARAPTAAAPAMIASTSAAGDDRRSRLET
jgi:hypothetical protein